MPGHILNIDFPEVNPTGAPGGDFEHISSSPEMFGGLTARGLGSLGEGVTRAADAGLGYLIETDSLANQIHASELHSWFSDQAGDLISKHAELQGRAAIDALPQLKQNIFELQRQAEGQSGNLQTRAMVAGNTRHTMDWLIGMATRHADGQRTAWATSTAKNNLDTATNIGGLAIAQLDFSPLDRQMRTIDIEAHNFFDPMGYDPDALASAVSQYKGKALRNWVETAATNLKDPDAIPHALQIFERFTKDIDPASRLAIDKYIKTAATNLVSDRLAVHFTSPAGRTEDNTLSPQMRSLLDTIAGSEVGSGGYDTLYSGKSIEKVRPDFDYTDHPRIMFPAQYGPTSAFGRYQITKTTWDADKDRFGLTDITPVSQDQWAAKKAAELYASSVKKGAFKQFGELSGNLDADLKANANNSQFIATIGHALSSEWTSLPGGLQPNAQTGSFVQRFVKNVAINNGVAPAIPDPQEAIDRIESDPALASRPDIRDAVVRKALARLGQQQRIFNLNRAADKDASDAEELKVFQNIHSGKPTVTLDQIIANPGMSKEAKERMALQLETVTGEKRVDQTYGNGFYDLYRRVHAPEGDPQRITDPGELYGHVGPNGDLTVAGVDKLVAEIQGRRTPEGVAEGEMKKQFLANARAQITGTDEGLHIKDPKGDELYLRFLAQVLPLYDKGRREGKPAAALLNPDSADYVGKAIAGFKRPMSQWYSDMIADKGEQTNNNSTGVDPNNVKSLDDLVTLYRNGGVDKATADAIAIAKGWGFKKPVQQTPQIPMSVQ